MRLRNSLPWMACTLVAAATVPAFALGEGPAAPASIVAHDPSFFQDTASADTTDNVVEIVAGETVTFSYPSGSSVHNVKFATAPTSCTQTAGMVLGAVPPLPTYSLPPGWAGTCSFSTPGDYTFVCEAHPAEMTGTVKVTAAATPTPTPTSTATVTPTETETPTATATASPVPVATVAAPPPPPPPPPAAVVLSDPLPKISSAAFKRSKKTLTFAGTIAAGATGKVKLELTYKVGKATKKKSASPSIAGGKYKGTIKLSASEAKKAQKLKLKLTYAGDSLFKAATKTGSVKVSR